MNEKFNQEKEGEFFNGKNFVVREYEGKGEYVKVVVWDYFDNERNGHCESLLLSKKEVLKMFKMFK